MFSHATMREESDLDSSPRFTLDLEVFTSDGTPERNRNRVPERPDHATGDWSIDALSEGTAAPDC